MCKLPPPTLNLPTCSQWGPVPTPTPGWKNRVPSFGRMKSRRKSKLKGEAAADTRVALFQIPKVALTPYEAKGWTSPLIGCVTATCSNGSFLSFVLLCSSSSVVSKQRGRLYCSTEGDQTLKKKSERKQVCVTNCFMSPVFPFQISRKSSAELLFDPIVHSTPNLQSGESLNVSPDWTVKAPFRSETDTSQTLTKPAVLQ